MSGDIAHTNAALVEAVLTGDVARTGEVRDAIAQAMAAAGTGSAPAWAAARALGAVHQRTRPERPLTADLQRALDGAVEVSAGPVAVLGPWVARLRVRTFDEPRLQRVVALIEAVAEAVDAGRG